MAHMNNMRVYNYGVKIANVVLNILNSDERFNYKIKLDHGIIIKNKETEEYFFYCEATENIHIERVDIASYYPSSNITRVVFSISNKKVTIENCVGELTKILFELLLLDNVYEKRKFERELCEKSGIDSAYIYFLTLGTTYETTISPSAHPLNTHYGISSQKNFKKKRFLWYGKNNKRIWYGDTRWITR